MTEVRVNRAAKHLAVVFSKKFGLVGELNDLSWADKGEVEWIEEKEPIFIFEIFAADFLERLGSRVPGVNFEEGCDFTNSSFDHF